MRSGRRARWIVLGVAAFAAIAAAGRRRQLARPLPRLDGAAPRTRDAVGQAQPLLPGDEARRARPVPDRPALLRLRRPAATTSSAGRRCSNADGWASIIVDSHGPRGFSEHEIWRLVCAGQLFMGSERAGDVLIAIDDARRMPLRRPATASCSIGSSHGGWAIMDLLALDPPRRLPTNLAGLPAGAPARPARGRRRRDPALPLLRPGQPRAPRRLDAGRSRPCSCSAPTTRSRPRASASRSPTGSRAAGMPVADRGLRRRHPRLRPGRPLGPQPARVRPGSHRGGHGRRPQLPRDRGRAPLGPDGGRRGRSSNEDAGV